MKSEKAKLVPMPAWPRRQIEWPTIYLFIGVVLTLAFSWSAFFYFRGPMWIISFIINIACVYGAFTILHEASHKNIFRSSDSWGNDILGIFAGITMHGAFEQFIAIHLKHHASVNNPDQDPDFHAKGPFSFKKLALWTLTLPHYLREFNRLDLGKGRSKTLIAIPYIIVAAIYAVGIYNGFLKELFVLYTLPSLIGVGITVLVFDHLPHHPHSDESRYGNAVVYDVKGWNWFFMGHSFHIIHHLWPSIPWYRYQDIYKKVRSELLEAGVKENSLSKQFNIS